MEMIKNQRGGIILNTLMYSAIVLFMSMMLLEFVKAHVYGQYAHMQKLNFQVLRSNVEGFLARNDVCSSGLLVNGTRVRYPGPSAAGVSLTEISSGGQTFVKLDQPLGAGMSISAIELHPDGTTPSTSGAETTYGVNLVLRTRKSGATFGGTNLDNTTDPIKLTISSDASGNIQSCSSSSAGALDFTKGEQCSVANVGTNGVSLQFPGGTYYVYPMIRMRNGQTANAAGRMHFFCVVPNGSQMGYLGACIEGVSCPW